ncbi:MAG: hypothetical protein A2V90_04230 [Gammaproteobacteria bacterium RBG_16_57_12]|nr:MAG: hypothetical protein A2V90_04230 [Gammaproteobacteria bacterium RBG_16_57_12]
MLSYRHSFHAGNAADVFKHIALVLLLRALLRKETPLCYLETHAGAGRYDLGCAEAQKNREYADGIGRLWSQGQAPAPVADYLALIRQFNPGQALNAYPGSPAIAQCLLRPQDRLVLCELHNSEYPLLKRLFSTDDRVAVHHQDGLQALKAFLPPRENRGLVFIDPAYELPQTWQQVVDSIQIAHRRWPNGSYAIWYPLIAGRSRQPFGTRLEHSGIRKILRADMLLNENERGMQGSGLIIVNPPWQVKETLEALLPWLVRILAVGQGAYTVDWLVEE